MTEETLARAKKINDELERLRKALRDLDESACEIMIWNYGEVYLPKSFKEPIKV